jgi:Ca2+/Na+ antiporter
MCRYIRAYKHSPNYTLLSFRKVRRKSDFELVELIVYVCVCVCVCVCVYVCMCMCNCMWMYMYVCMYIYIYLTFRSNQLKNIQYMFKYICLKEKDVYLKSKLQNTETWSSPAWSPRRLCYRPVVFFHHLRFTALSFSQEKIFGVGLNNVTFSISLLYWRVCKIAKYVYIASSCRSHWMDIHDISYLRIFKNSVDRIHVWLK